MEALQGDRRGEMQVLVSRAWRSSKLPPQTCQAASNLLQYPVAVLLCHSRTPTDLRLITKGCSTKLTSRVDRMFTGLNKLLALTFPGKLFEGLCFTPTVFSHEGLNKAVSTSPLWDLYSPFILRASGPSSATKFAEVRRCTFVCALVT